jgi:cystathionine beta-lyase
MNKFSIQKEQGADTIMTYDFDQLIDRRPTESSKWHSFDEDVLPMFVADMDFRSPEPVIQALCKRAEHGVFGYANEPVGLRLAIIERMERLYGWQVEPRSIVFLPGVVTAFNLACHAFARPGEGVLVQTPVYQPFLNAPRNAGLIRQEVELTTDADGRYTVDYGAFEAAITQNTRLFILCNPHNPVGRVFKRDELERMAEICFRHNVMICSDEIHGDLIYSGQKHFPLASFDPEISSKTITLMAPSKTFNIAGLDCSFAIIENEAVRKIFESARQGMVPGVNLFGYVAALAAYREGQSWLNEVLAYLEGNRDFLYDFLKKEIPGIKMWKPEGTYLAWLDCRGLGISGNQAEFFLKSARVAVNEGASYGKGGDGFVRLNFGCPRSMLQKALERMKKAVDSR